MKDIAWKLFEQTGNIAYYELYKELSDGCEDESGSAPGNGFQGKR